MIQNLLTHIDNYQLVSIHLVTYDELEIEVKESIGALRNKAATEASHNMAHHRMMIRQHGFATAYNLNGGVWSTYVTSYLLYHFANNYQREDLTNCKKRDQRIPAAFYTDSYRRDKETYLVLNVPIDFNSTGSVDGFFTDCMPIEAILSSTLDCLYSLSCLQLLADHFPLLNEVDVVTLSFSHSTNLHRYLL